MTPSNLLAWSLQIGALVLVAALTSHILRLRVPAARLFFWQMVLLVCLSLPLIRPWKHQIVTDAISVTTVAVARSTGTAAPFRIALDQAVLWLIAAGVVARGCWLAAGFWRLRRYRRRSRLLERRSGAALLLSEDVASPVTFGALRPVVLLPDSFPDLDARVREAILCHELLHVHRRDWVFTVAEELIRTVWWFHPAIWWLLGQIQLAREQAVDREVIARTQAREEYVDALLAIAGARPRLDLAPAPLFLRQRHLKQRVVSILKEVRMSKPRLISSLGAALGVLVAGSWFVTATFPLAAAPENVADSPGVTVELNGATLLHRAPVLYPETARQRGVQGTVVVQMKIDGGGGVADAQVIIGPEELRKASLQSVLSWHFTRNLAGGTFQAAIAFSLPGGDNRAPQGPVPPVSASTPTPAPPIQRTIRTLSIAGLPDEARADLLSRLPVHEGDTLSAETLRQLVQSVRSFDEHLAVTTRPLEGGAAAVFIAIPPAPPAIPLPMAPAAQDGALARIRVGGNVQSMKLVAQPKPVYPP